MAESDKPRSPFAAMADFSAQRAVRVLSADEIEQMLTSHRVYLRTEYHEGHRADLSSADLTGLDFARLDLRGIKMERAVLRGATFIGANLRGANLIGATAQEGRFDRADLSRARLSGANLVAASFMDACLAKAEMEFAVMANAVFQGACLCEADMSGTVVDGAVLTGADLRKANIGFAKTSEAVTYERMKAKVDEALKAHFRPEFLNRIDEVIVFHELSRAEVTEIVDLLMSRTVKQLSDQGIGLELTPAARSLLAEKGYDPQLGARPLRRAIQQLVEDPLSERILWKEFRVGETIVVDVEESPIDGEGPQLSFRSIEGIEPPPLELAGAGTDPE